MFPVILLASVVCSCLIQNLVVSAVVTDVCPPQLPRDQYLQVRGDSCYQFVFFRKLTHSAAEADCESDGGWLVQIKNQDIQNYIHNQVLSRYHHPLMKLWIGLSHTPGQIDFLWVDGTDPNYTHWAPGEGVAVAQDRGHADCVIMDMASVGRWRAVPCDFGPMFSASQTEEAYPYICEYSVHPTTTASNTVVATHTESPGTTTPGPLGSCPAQICSLDCGVHGFKLDPTSGCAVCECAAEVS